MITVSKVVGFLRETQRETSKVTWPSQRETVTTTVAVVVMAVVGGAFFFVVDSVLGATLRRLLGMGG